MIVDCPCCRSQIDLKEVNGRIVATRVNQDEKTSSNIEQFIAMGKANLTGKETSDNPANEVIRDLLKQR